MQPWMSDQDINYITSFLDEKANEGPIEALEWGMGGSTVFFTGILNSLGATFKWTSIEHDVGWFQKVRAQSPKAELHLYGIKTNEYTNLPLKTGKKFDFILVDGRERAACLKIAHKVVTPQTGAVFLHDAWRARYQPPLTLYTKGEFLSKMLWKGSVS